MMTRQEAINLDHRRELHHVSERNRENEPIRCRVNGKCKTWKTRPDEFRLPVVYGLRDYFYINHTNAHEWATSEEEARKQNRKNRDRKAAVTV